jgi:hypothetical protein
MICMLLCIEALVAEQLRLASNLCHPVLIVFKRCHPPRSMDCSWIGHDAIWSGEIHHLNQSQLWNSSSPALA